MAAIAVIPVITVGRVARGVALAVTATVGGAALKEAADNRKSNVVSLPDATKSNGKKSDGKKSDDEKSDEEESDDEEFDDKKTDDAKAPGKPTEADGYVASKRGDRLVREEDGKRKGWEDKKGDLWIPTGPGRLAHGGPHWDVQKKRGGYTNVYPNRRDLRDD
ncbi:hypothetical protein H072_744 [Dactylellina haptotyla CBS 200.50]|uniref:Toxin 37-like C-terminal domain-containing protein n=1 Tax=Dactylellina haptotyla (strain CBS 200.50) TaxID=1284197 RepID=S8AQW5_DACHA|nr:hypothetical protein H072_744 [Dactylellina haptotyla CBS 200.50]